MPIPALHGGRRAPSPAPGFTLVELVVVLALMAILTALTVPRLAQRQDFDTAVFVEEVAAAARYAQKRALASRCPVRFRLGVEGYALDQPAPPPPLSACGANWDQPVRAPGGGAFAGPIPAGVQLIAGDSLPLQVIYAGDGRISAAGPVVVQIGLRELRIHAPSGYVETR